MTKLRILKAIIFVGTTLGVSAFVYQPDQSSLADLPNRIPEAAPYITAEAAAFPPPYEEQWVGDDNPGQCRSCDQKIFDEWNGSMMSNSWRDPVWRSCFWRAKLLPTVSVILRTLPTALRKRTVTPSQGQTSAHQTLRSARGITGSPVLVHSWTASVPVVICQRTT